MTESILAPVAALHIPDSALLTNRAQQALAFIQAFEIDSTEAYGLAADELKAIKVRANTIEEQRTAITGPINKALKAVNDLFRGPGELLAQAEKMLKGKMVAWDQEQQRLARIEREKAEAIAAAERKKLEDEAAARQAEAYAQAAAAAKAAAEGNAQAAALARAAADRANAEAQASATAAQLVVAAPAVVAVEKTKGISTSTKLDFEVVDLLALVQHIAARPDLLPLLAVDTVRLRALVKGLGMACKLPGVRVFEERVMSARA
jgi:hypothetical protein